MLVEMALVKECYKRRSFERGIFSHCLFTKYSVFNIFWMVRKKCLGNCFLFLISLPLNFKGIKTVSKWTLSYVQCSCIVFLYPFSLNISSAFPCISMDENFLLQRIDISHDAHIFRKKGKRKSFVKEENCLNANKGCKSFGSSAGTIYLLKLSLW